MKNFGADALFFVPEYMGEVNALSAAMVGIAMGVFFMSWNITTFILHTRRFKFLATAAQPFLKYCINNSVLPILFFIFYLIRSIQFDINMELYSLAEQLILIVGFLGGFLLLIGFSFAFFFGADRQILRRFAPIVGAPEDFKKSYDPYLKPQPDAFGMRVDNYFSTRMGIRKARKVTHYSEVFLDSIFKRHHFSGMLGILLAFFFLFIGGFFLDIPFFQVPAAASILVFFAILVAVIGALTYFLQSWSVLFVIALVIVLNVLYENEIIDPRNKAYGLNYENKTQRPTYNKAALQQLCLPQQIETDRANMIAILNKWKAKQQVAKPKMLFINVSGGGLRSATFVMHALQQIDRITGKQFMQQTFLISGASGGMLSAAYYRALYLRQQSDTSIQLQSPQYTSAITQDLLNPIFSSMVSRDIFSPAQKFSVGPYKYVKDRGYAFEQKLNENTDGILNTSLKDYTIAEQNAQVPLIIFNAVITRDGRKMMASTQPISFMMKPVAFANDTSVSPDAVDFSAFLKNQDPQQIRLLTLLRMNATFPYVLPNVWLPTKPIIDVMDAGIRDNYGQETTIRFIDNFKEWIAANTSGVVIVQLRDRPNHNWQNPLETGSVTDFILKPATMLQHNWYKLQDFSQTDQYSYLKDAANYPVHRVTFMYAPHPADKGAALNFHLTASEKKAIIASFSDTFNQQNLGLLQSLLKQ
ncbi:MAG: hypothetical protein ACOYKE_04465 [Ferruginibacter sp.]